MADTKLTALAALAVLTADDLLYAVDDPAGTPAEKSITAAVARNYSNMAYAALTIDTANVDAVVNTIHYATIAGLTAARNWTLPATAAVGDRCGLFIADGDASFTVIIKANTGDTLDGVSAAEWSRVFIVNELVICRCVVANTTWIVENDQRIVSKAAIELTTDADAETAATLVLPTDFGGAWTERVNVGFTTDTSTGKLTPRRAGLYDITFAGRSKDSTADQTVFQVDVFKNATTSMMPVAIRNSGTGATGICTAVINQYTVALADYFQFRFLNTAGSLGCRGATQFTQLAMKEVL